MRGPGAIVAAALLLSGCGGGDGTADVAAPAADAGTSPRGIVEVVEPRLDHTPAAADEAVAAAVGDEVGEGDLLATDPAGFGELGWPDGSFTRIGPDTSFRVVRLRSTVDRPDVRIALDVGRTFHAVDDLGVDGSFEVGTAVGIAAVRGTAFAVICLQPTSCTIIVVDGTVEVTDLTGLAVLVDAGEQVTLDEDGVGEPVPAGPDPWVDDNLGRGVPGVDPDSPVAGGPAAQPPPPAEQLWTLEDVVAATAAHPSSGNAWTLTSCDDALATHEGEGDPASRCQWNRDEIQVLLAPFSVTTRTYWLQDPATPRSYGACPDGEVLAEVREAEGIEVRLEQCLIDNSGVDNGIGRAVATIDGYDLVIETFWAAKDDQNTRDDLAARERHWDTLLSLVRAGLLRYLALS